MSITRFSQKLAKEYNLTPGEEKLLDLYIISGISQEDICELLDITSVIFYVRLKNIYRKFEISPEYERTEEDLLKDLVMRSFLDQRSLIKRDCENEENDANGSTKKAFLQKLSKHLLRLGAIGSGKTRIFFRAIQILTSASNTISVLITKCIVYTLTIFSWNYDFRKFKLSSYNRSKVFLDPVKNLLIKIPDNSSSLLDTNSVISDREILIHNLTTSYFNQKPKSKNSFYCSYKCPDYFDWETAKSQYLKWENVVLGSHKWTICDYYIYEPELQKNAQSWNKKFLILLRRQTLVTYILLPSVHRLMKQFSFSWNDIANQVFHRSQLKSLRYLECGREIHKIIPWYRKVIFETIRELGKEYNREAKTYSVYSVNKDTSSDSRSLLAEEIIENNIKKIQKLSYKRKMNMDCWHYLWEYHRLVVLWCLNEKETDSLQKIIEQALINESLSWGLNCIDALVTKNLKLASSNIQFANYNEVYKSLIKGVQEQKKIIYYEAEKEKEKIKVDQKLNHIEYLLGKSDITVTLNSDDLEAKFTGQSKIQFSDNLSGQRSYAVDFSLDKTVNYELEQDCSIQEWNNTLFTSAQRMTEGEEGGTKFSTQRQPITPDNLANFRKFFQNHNPASVTLDYFSALVREVNLSPSFLNQFINFINSDNFNVSIIDKSDFHQISVISWSPTQHTSKHCHPDFYDIIWVYQGTLTQVKFTSDQNKCEHFSQGSWVKLDFPTEHQLFNTTGENLVTVHFQFYPDSMCKGKNCEISQLTGHRCN